MQCAFLLRVTVQARSSHLILHTSCQSVSMSVLLNQFAVLAASSITRRSACFFGDGRFAAASNPTDDTSEWSRN
jgi:hypothetical protein